MRFTSITIQSLFHGSSISFYYPFTFLPMTPKQMETKSFFYELS